MARSSILTWGLTFLLIVASSHIQHVQASPGGFPLDLYMVMDSSVSIGNKNELCQSATGDSSITCWDLFVGFANDTQSALATRVNGYYEENPGEDGLRVSVITFDACNDQKEFIPITGNKTIIDNGITSLYQHPLSFGTCPSGALQDVVDEIITPSGGIDTSSRPKAVLFISDGEVLSNDRTRTNNVAADLNAIPGVSTFVLGIGDRAIGAQAQNIVGGNTNHIFVVEDASFLTTVVNFISAFILNDLSFQVKEDLQVVQPFDPDTNELCVGATESRILLQGRSVAILQGQNTECVFTFPNKVDSVVVTAASVDDDLECPYPVNLEHEVLGNGISAVQNFTVFAQVNQGDESPKQIGDVVELSIPVSSCMSVSSNSEGLCVGENVEAVFTEQVAGQLARFTSVESATFSCNFYSANDDTLLLHTGSAEVQIQSVRCVAPPLLDANLGTLYGSAELVIESPSIGEASENLVIVERVSFLPAVYALGESCATPRFPDGDVCWSSPFSIEFTGSFLDTVSSTHTLQCVLNAPHLSNVIGVLTKLQENSYSCEVPGYFAEQDGQETTYNTVVSLRIESSGANVIQYNHVFSVDPCLSIPPEKQVCLGNALELVFVGPSAALLAAADGVSNDLECVFSIEGSTDTVNRTISFAMVNGDTVISCVAPPSIGEYLGVVFSKIQLLFGSAGVVFQQDLDVNILPCFDLLDQNTVLLSEKQVGLQACWGDTPGQHILIQGDSAMFLQGAPVSCEFGSSDLTVEALPVMDEGGQAGFRCNVPDELYVLKNDGRVFDVRTRIRVEGNDNQFNFPYSEDIKLLASTGDPNCMNREIVNLNSRPGGIVCWGDLVRLEVEGIVADRVALQVGDHQLVCKLDGLPEQYNYTYGLVGNNMVGDCLLPREVSINVQADHRIQLVDLDDGNRVVIETQLPAVQLDNSENCVVYSFPATEDGTTICIGGIVPNEYSISGVVIDLIISGSGFDVSTGLRCRWSGESGVTDTAPMLRSDAKSIVCTAPPWEPWIDPNTGFFSRLEIFLTNEGVLVSALDLLETKLCLGKQHPSTITSTSTQSPPAATAAAAFPNPRLLKAHRQTQVLARETTAVPGKSLGVATTSNENGDVTTMSETNRMLGAVATPQLEHGACWPFCCLSSNNSILADGQSASALERPQDSGLVECVYSSTRSVVVPESTRVANQFTLSDGLARYECSRATWSPFEARNQTDFKFTQVNVTVAGNYIKGFELPEISTVCIRQLAESATSINGATPLVNKLSVCRGEPITTAVDGITLDAALQWQQEDPDNRRVDCTIHFNTESVSDPLIRKLSHTHVQRNQFSSIGSIDAIVCKRQVSFRMEKINGGKLSIDAVEATSDILLPPVADGTLAPIDEWADAWRIDALRTIVPGWKYKDVAECVSVEEPTCAENSSGRVLVSGRTISSLLARNVKPEFQCVFATSQETLQETRRVASPELIPSSEALLCVYNLTAFGERYFEMNVLFPQGDVDAGDDAEFSTVVASVSLTCPETLFGPPGRGIPLTGGAIAGLVLGIILFLVFLVVFCRCYSQHKARRDKQEESRDEQERKSGLRRGSGGDSVLAKPHLWGDNAVNIVVAGEGFKPGDRVEARYLSNPGQNDSVKSAWWKGVVLGKDNGEYEVGFDDGKIPDQSGITGDDIREPLSDFKVGQTVLVSRGIGDQSTRPGIIAEVESNNKYTIQYKSMPGERDEESGVRGARIQGATDLHFQPGDVIECEQVDNGHWLRGVIQNQVPEKFEFQIKYDELQGVEVDTEIVDVSRLRVPRFDVGDVVEAQIVSQKEQRSGTGKPDFPDRPWHRAQISRANDDHTYRVTYDAKGIADNNSLGIKWIRRPQFQVGDVIEVLKNGTWQPARVTNVDENNTYNLAYSQDSDNMDEKYVLAPLLRRPVAAFAVGDKVEVRAPAEWGVSKIWHSAVVTKVQSGTVQSQVKYSVKYDDDSLTNGRSTEKDVVASRVQPFLDTPLLLSDNDGESIASHPSFSLGVDTTPMLVPTPSTPKQSPTSRKEHPTSPVAAVPQVSSLASPQKPPAPAKDIVSSALTTNFRPPPRQHSSQAEGPGMKPMRLRFKRTAPIDFAELPNNTFEVKLDMSQGLGISLGWTKESTIIVAGFKDLHNGDWGPVEACGLVGLKDQLLAVNGRSIGGLSFATVSQMISTSPKLISLRFGRSHDDKISLALT